VIVSRWGRDEVAALPLRPSASGVVALARKLAGVLWAMWRDGTVYDRAEQAEKAAHGVKVAARRQHHRAGALDRAAKKLRRKEVTENASPRHESQNHSTSSEMNAT
jgi:hypothetical protein